MGLNLQGDNDIGPLWRAVFGASTFQALYAATKLGVFEQVNAHPGQSVEELANGLKVPRRGAAVLVRALLALGLLSTDDSGHGIALAGCVVSAMESGDWDNIAAVVAYQQEISYGPLARFYQAIQEDRNCGLEVLGSGYRTVYEALEDDSQRRHAFHDGMDAWSKLATKDIWSKIDLPESTQLLDVGGGTGTNALALAALNPGIEVTVTDLPQVVGNRPPVVLENGSVVRFLSRDLNEPLPFGYHQVLFANILMLWSRSQVESLLRSAAYALPPGGKVNIFGILPWSHGAASDEYSALDGIYFHTVPTAHGFLYSEDDLRALLATAGLTEISVLRPPSGLPHAIMTARHREQTS